MAVKTSSSMAVLSADVCSCAVRAPKIRTGDGGCVCAGVAIGMLLYFVWAHGRLNRRTEWGRVFWMTILVSTAGGESRPTPAPSPADPEISAPARPDRVLGAFPS